MIKEFVKAWDANKSLLEEHIKTPDQALRAAEIAKEETIDKACDWLNNFYSEDRPCFLVKEDIGAFIKAMEG